ncbi:DNA-binding protein [Candidatus Bathyarchaeota archaeon]|nr:DNA-binding protein [Candidatus Bathyarchaeota archaeon]MBS7613443.1 DNA-binding protein [Candidatus Bathyarchaeota archaeon]MBS7617681.1 DNA-binding protein [Candidatus Bathyarchaeota archaeon]
MVAEDLELEELKRRKLLELQKRLEEERRVAEAKEKYEAEKQAMLRVILTPDARQRLSNLKIVKPDFVEKLENELIQAVQSGRIEPPITDEILKRILIRLQGSQRREIRIRRI